MVSQIGRTTSRLYFPDMTVLDRGGRRALAAAMVLGVCVLLSPAPRVSAQRQADLDQRFLDAWKQQTRTTLSVPAGGAKVVIVKFNDWMCPGCRYWYEQLAPVLAKYRSTPNAIKYVEKDWPWNADCNPAVQQTIPGHEAACLSAAAVRLAADRGKREAMVDWLYTNQPRTAAERQTMIDRVKAKTGELLGIADVTAAMAAKLPEIRKDVAEGVAARIQSTPTYFINGIRAAGPDNSIPALHYLDLAIQYELKK
jgi:protein-disulfide isomerase